ncbi:hypothetical protein ACKWTF_010599 [Chironomus riparius]
MHVPRRIFGALAPSKFHDSKVFGRFSNGGWNMEAPYSFHMEGKWSLCAARVSIQKNSKQTKTLSDISNNPPDTSLSSPSNKYQMPFRTAYAALFSFFSIFLLKDGV